MPPATSCWPPSEIGIAAQVHDWVAGEVTLLYEEDDTDLEVDVALISVAPPAGPWAVNAGQLYVPFGVFDSNLVSDPLTLEIGETRETSVQAGFEIGSTFGSLYAFNGTNKKNGNDRIDNWGANLGYGVETDSYSFTGAIGYITDLGDSDTLQDALASNDVTDYTAGWSIAALVETGPFTIIGEYLGATDAFDAAALDFNGAGAKPRAWNIEAGYGFRITDRDAVFAVGYQATIGGIVPRAPRATPARGPVGGNHGKHAPVLRMGPRHRLRHRRRRYRRIGRHPDRSARRQPLTPAPLAAESWCSGAYLMGH